MYAVPSFANASFESGTTDWTFSGGAHIRTGWGPGYDGTSWAWVGRRDSPSALIKQTVSGFAVGATYELTFLMATESFSYNGGRGDTVNVAITGVSTLAQDFTQSNAPTTTPAWGLWEQQTYTFVADAATLTFAVHGYPDGYLGYRSADTGVDRFALTEVSGVPDAGTTSGLLGMAALGLAAARRRLT